MGADGSVRRMKMLRLVKGAAVCPAAMVPSCSWECLPPSEAVAGTPALRVDKVSAIRQQLADRTYDVDGHLDAILGELLACIVGQAKEAGGEQPTRKKRLPGIAEWRTGGRRRVRSSRRGSARIIALGQ